MGKKKEAPSRSSNRATSAAIQPGAHRARERVKKLLRDYVGQNEDNWARYLDMMEEAGYDRRREWNNILLWLNGKPLPGLPKLMIILQLYPKFARALAGLPAAVCVSRDDKLEKQVRDRFKLTDHENWSSHYPNVQALPQGNWPQFFLSENRVWVLDLSSDLCPCEQKQAFATFAAQEIAELLNGALEEQKHLLLHLGLSGGRTLLQLATKLPDLLQGAGTLHVHSLEPNVDVGDKPIPLANEVAKFFCHQLGATGSQYGGLHLAKGKPGALGAAACDLCLIGVGALAPNSPLVTTATQNGVSLDDLREAGAVGDLFWSPIDKDGNAIAHKWAFLKNLTAVSVDFVKNDMVANGKVLIGIAMGGQEKDQKAAALRAYLQGGLISGLIVDKELAQAALDLDKKLSPGARRSQRHSNDSGGQDHRSRAVAD